MKRARLPLVSVAAALLTIACASTDPGLMSFSEYAVRAHSFPQVLQIQGASGALFYYGAAHTSDPAEIVSRDVV